MLPLFPKFVSVFWACAKSQVVSTGAKIVSKNCQDCCIYVVSQKDETQKKDESPQTQKNDYQHIL